MANKINQKEYLKKYLSSDVSSKKKHKKKKKQKAIVGQTIQIIDDDIDISKLQKIDDDDLDLMATGEDAPQIVGVIDDRPPELQAQDYKNSGKWKVVSNDDGFVSNLEIQQMGSDGKYVSNFEPNREEIKKIKKGLYKIPDRSPRRNNLSPNSSPQRRRNRSPGTSSQRKMRRSSDDSPPRRSKGSSDASPPRKNKRIPGEFSQRRNKRSPDASPPRRSKRSPDASPVRRSKRSPDASPPRRSKRSPDASPPRRSKRSPDASPPRKSKRSPDASPARRSKRSPDASPPRRSKRSPDASPVRRSKRSPDASPPRRSKRTPDDSPPRRHRRSPDSSRSRRRGGSLDESPPRRNNRSPDLSPRRKMDNFSPSHSRKRSSPPPSHSRKYRDFSPPLPTKIKRERSSSRSLENQRSSSPGPSTSKRMTKTLDGKTAGLQNALELRVENSKFKERERKLFEAMSEEMSGQHADVVRRDRKTGRIRDLQKEAEKQSKKDQKEAARKAIYDRWGAGLKQVEEHKSRVSEMAHEMSKPLARYADDNDLDEHLKNQERIGDPMLDYIRQKRQEKRKELGIPELPKYEGQFPDNRFNIRPGYRWDGVDRSNGYEKKWFENINKKKAAEEEAYRYSTEDM